MSVWRDRARARIAELVRDLPEDASVQERRRALWGKGHPAHGGTSWGRKMWGKEVRLYLARHGDLSGACKRPMSLPRFLAEHGYGPEDISFPFRGEL